MSAYELDDDVYEQITTLCREGDELVGQRNYRDAIKKYRDAWKLIPTPQTDWGASTFVLGAISDAYLYNKDYQPAREALEYAMHCPDGLGNPYLHLRLGQACFELGDMDKAADELTRAYMGGGLEIFANQSPKYLEFLKTKITL